jgi:hypothetical protein
MNEIEEQLEDGPRWALVQTWSETLLMDASDMYGLVVFMVCMTAVDFWRSVISVVEAYPAQLLWLVYAMPGTPCEHRSRVAAEILDGKALNRHGRPEFNACRLKDLYPADLEVAKTAGTLCKPLHLFFCCVRTHWKSDTQDQEGANVQVQGMVNAAHNLGFGTLATRFAIRRKLRRRALEEQISTNCSDGKAMRRSIDRVVEDTQLILILVTRRMLSASIYIRNII